MAKILVVEDDESLSRMVSEWLVGEHHNVECSFDGADALEKLEFYDFDLIILDLNLPSMGGIKILKQFRASGKQTPVLILTGQDKIEDKELGLDSGADDYLTKPFHMKELSARVRAVLRRPTSYVGDKLSSGGLELDPGNHSARVDGNEVSLLPKEFALLEFLMRHPDQVFSADALLNRVWASASDSSIDALTTCVKRLRKKIDKDGQPSYIKTVHGVGYKLNVAD
ncbi:MAG: DNA-binding response regulator [Cyanobacteria bacterium PR.3.49]|jgi:DNA-binding response OmpR family regulator|nr:DNA-binding response regulator [Cyanobacteria bacterium PR.3.49]